jgi:hypothetical protein
MGMSNGGAAPCVGFGVGGFEFDDGSPLRSISFVETHPIASSALAAVTVRLEVVVGDPVVPVRLRGTPRALMSSLACSPPSALVGVWAMRAVPPAWLRLLHRLVVPERMRRGIPKQLGDEIELV